MTVEDSKIYPHSHDILFLEFRDELSEHLVLFEDNGKVAYAYLLKGNVIDSDVWLYNHGSPPERAEWNIPENMPFTNPKGFASEEIMTPVIKPDDVEVVWAKDETPGVVSALVKIRGEVYGLLKSGVKPGWSKLTIRDGPLARQLKDNTSDKF